MITFISRGTDTLSREKILSKVFLLPSGKKSTLKGKKLLPLGNQFFPFRVKPFSEMAWRLFGFCLFLLPLGDLEGLRLVLVALPGFFSYLFWHYENMPIQIY